MFVPVISPQSVCLTARPMSPRNILLLSRISCCYRFYKLNAFYQVVSRTDIFT